MAEDEGMLRRWSRRKVEAREQPPAKGDVASKEDDVLAAVPPTSAGALAETEDPGPTHTTSEAGEEIIADPAGLDGADDGDIEDLPDVESLDKDSDYRGFMREGVPGKLRNMALRKLWLSDPAFSYIDGMVEYGEDFTDAATVIEGMKSIYEVGKGYITEEDEEKDEEEDGEEAAEDEAVAAAANPAPESEDDEASEQAALASPDSDAESLQTKADDAPAAESEADGAPQGKNQSGVGAKT